MEVKDKLKERRIELNLTLDEVGRLTGVSGATISRWESGDIANMKRDKIMAYANALKISPAVIMDWNEDIKPNDAKPSNRIPVVGMIQAGLPIDAIEDPIDWEEVTPQMKSLGELFCLQVKGDSMQPRIVEGDVVVVLKQSDIESGEIGIVRVNGDTATIKKVMKYDDGSIALVPSNPTYSVMRYSKEEIVSKPVEIIGKVIELRAKF